MRVSLTSNVQFCMVKFLSRKEVNMAVHVGFEQIDSKNVYYIVRVASTWE